jgi:hypothetical protein
MNAEPPPTYGQLIHKLSTLEKIHRELLHEHGQLLTENKALKAELIGKKYKER